MKLWQKVFCISLVCVILVTGGTTLLVLLNNFRASVRQAVSYTHLRAHET